MALTNRIENKTLCRTLNFGKCRIKEEDKQFLRKEFESLRKSESNKWNFDFYNERPIKEGRYEWKRVAGDSFYINPNKAWTFNAKGKLLTTCNLHYFLLLSTLSH